MYTIKAIVKFENVVLDVVGDWHEDDDDGEIDNGCDLSNDCEWIFYWLSSNSCEDDEVGNKDSVDGLCDWAVD